MALVAALAAACLLALSPWSGGRSHASHGGPPHVIMITTDDQTVRDMVALPQTQALIGAAGVSFTNAYASYPLCCPSRATLLTGQHAHNHGVLGNTAPDGGYEMLRDEETLPGLARALELPADPHRQDAERLRRHRPHLRPARLGAVPAGGEFYGFLPDPPSAYTGFKLNENGVPIQYEPEDYQTDVYADKAVDRIGNHLTTFPNRPLYMEVQFFAPHDPATPAPRHDGAFSTALIPTDASLQREEREGDKPGWLRAVNRMGPGLISKVQTRYRNRLETLLAVDDAVSAIVNELDVAGSAGRDLHRLHLRQRLHAGPAPPAPGQVRRL